MSLESARTIERRDRFEEGDVLAYGREVVGLEAAALGKLAEAMDESFVHAVSLILRVPGRVVVSGMGKSGHIGRKIAATFASTGTPAVFVHPAEASHGDLGMLITGDALLVLSNSGRTPELRSIMMRAKSLMVPMVAIAAQAGSPVMQAADVRLLLPRTREACPVNIAPTTSTAMMLGLGDALAMALMRARGVSRDRLHALHPGGMIGQRLMPVSAVMHAGDRMPLVTADASMREVIVTMTTMSFGVAGVVDEERRLIGIITDGDLRRHIDELMSSCAGDVMTRGPVTVTLDSMTEDAIALMNANRITSLFVVSSAEPWVPVGLVHIHDFLRPGQL
ncbi:MAG: KpsF/GutQ family sugar-phosphate isomerase [Sphingomonas bacterium]|nr:KpsF/GutQ family sugar-phosphate isomerase [Sphingomonas bacterium]MDB5690433.1 KpsF/GutQ family sugar-phosphate isomerase [Sphingomonas bacterium]